MTTKTITLTRSTATHHRNGIFVFPAPGDSTGGYIHIDSIAKHFDINPNVDRFYIQLTDAPWEDDDYYKNGYRVIPVMSPSFYFRTILLKPHHEPYNQTSESMDYSILEESSTYPFLWYEIIGMGTIDPIYIRIQIDEK